MLTSERFSAGVLQDSLCASANTREEEVLSVGGCGFFPTGRGHDSQSSRVQHLSIDEVRSLTLGHHIA